MSVPHCIISDLNDRSLFTQFILTKYSHRISAIRMTCVPDGGKMIYHAPQCPTPGGAPSTALALDAMLVGMRKQGITGVCAGHSLVWPKLSLFFSGIHGEISGQMYTSFIHFNHKISQFTEFKWKTLYRSTMNVSPSSPPRELLHSYFLMMQF